MSEFYIEAEYTVIEGMRIEADTIEEAEDKMLEMLRLGVTNRDIVGDTCDEAEIVGSEPVDDSKDGE